MDPILLPIARSFAAKVKVNFDTPVRAQPGDQLKGARPECFAGADRDQWLKFHQLRCGIGQADRWLASAG